MRALLDVDGVLADFPRAALRWLNGRCRSDAPEFTLDQVTQHDILKAVGRENYQDAFDTWCHDTDMCRHLEVYPGAREFVAELQTFADVVIVTKSYEKVRGWEHSRRAWLREHFGITKKDIAFIDRKELVQGDFFLDDKLPNVERWQAAWPSSIGMVFDRPLNQKADCRRAFSFTQALGMALALNDALKRERAVKEQR